MGACIQCGSRNCFQAFHVTCGKRAKLYLKMKSTHGGPATLDASVLKAYCDKHVPNEWQEEHNVAESTAAAKDFYSKTMKGRRWADSQSSALGHLPSQQQHLPSSIGEEFPFRSDDQNTGSTAAQKKRKLAAQKSVWRLPSGAPIIPQLVLNAVESALHRFQFRKRKEFVAEACKYWTLKREARRGAALLKRLQLQMESFATTEITRRNFAAMGAIGRPRLQNRIEIAEQLLSDLNALRKICQEIQEREERKLEDAELIKRIVDTAYFPVSLLLEPILDKAQR